MGNFKLSNAIHKKIQKTQPSDLEMSNQSNNQSSQKIDLVILAPDQAELSDWRDSYKDLSKMGGLIGLPLFGNSKGYICYIAAYSDYFGTGLCQKCFDCPEFPETFKSMGATQSVVDSIYNWMVTSNCNYEMEGLMAFYAANSKLDAIKTLKSCQYVGKIYEIDANDNIIAVY